MTSLPVDLWAKLPPPALGLCLSCHPGQRSRDIFSFHGLPRIWLLLCHPAELSWTFLFKLHSIVSLKRWTEREGDWSISYFKSGVSRTVFCCQTRLFFVSKIEQKWKFEDLCVWSALLIWQTTFAGKVCFGFVLFFIPSYWEDKRLGSCCRALWLILLYARLADLPETGTLEVNQANEAAQRGDVHYFVSHNDFKVNTHTVPGIL